MSPCHYGGLAMNNLSNDVSIIDPFDYTPLIEGDIETNLQMAENN